MNITFKYAFECVACGDCCRWPGEVRLTAPDIARLAADLDLSEDDVVDTHTRLSGTRRGQLCLNDGPDGACVFLRADRCTIYDGRPSQCRRFPFPETTPTECPGLSIVVDDPE